jgi:hypothetical protein
MGVRTVRLDDETEKVLRDVVRRTGWSVLTTLKRGLMVLRDQVTEQARVTLFDLYRKLDLGPGGYALAPSTETRRGVVAALRRKSRR